MLERAPLRDLLSRSSYAGNSVEVRRELPFAFVASDGPPGLVVGRADRLVIVRNAKGEVERAEVVDFKTDQLADPTPAGIALHAEGYGEQMDAYREGVSRRAAGDPTSKTWTQRPPANTAYPTVLPPISGQTQATLAPSRERIV